MLRSRDRARCCWQSRPAVSAAPTCTSSTASSSVPKLPLILGHQIVGTVAGAGEGAERFTSGSRVGVPWLGWACGECRYCTSGRENLCDRALFTGYDLDGGYAEFAVADERFCLPLPGALRRRAGRAAALRRADRLSRARARRRCAADRLLRVRRGGPHPRQVARPRGPRGLRVHAARRRGGAGIRAQPRRRLGRRLGRDTARAARRSDRVRRRRRADAAALRAARRARA